MIIYYFLILIEILFNIYLFNYGMLNFGNIYYGKNRYKFELQENIFIT